MAISKIVTNSVDSGVTLTSPTLSGAVSIAAGTALLPALTTTGDTNTGVWFPAADTIAASTAGTERMRIDSSGSVGIGVTTGTSKVTIFNSPGYGHFNSGNSAENGSFPLVGAFNNPAIESATYGWGFYDSSATGNLSIYRRNGSTTGVKTCEWNRSNGNFSFDSGYGSVATAYGCRAWVNFNGSGTVAIRASGNVSSITDNGTGNYTVNFTTAMPDANYVAMVSASSTSNTTFSWVMTSPSQAIVLPTTSAFTVVTNNLTNSAQIDATNIMVSVFR